LNTISADLKKKLSESREYREEFVAAFVKRAFARQVKTIRKARGLLQEELAAKANVDQGVISRAENPNYGNLTFNTGFRVAAGFDLAFIPKLVTFGEFLEWVDEATEGFTDLPSFEREIEIEAAASVERKKAPARSHLRLVVNNALSGITQQREQERVGGQKFAGVGIAMLGGQNETRRSFAG